MVKIIMILIILIFVGFFTVSNSQDPFLPNLPFGEYRVIPDKMYPCESTRNHSIKLNLYFSKKTSNITEMRGNLTFLIPFNDALIFDINLASWGSTGGWIPNACIIIIKNPCSTLKNIMGKAWLVILKAFNIPSRCPILMDTYSTSGLDMMDIIESHNFPKIFFYGKYKAVCKIRSIKNQIFGCVAFEFTLLRPWEKPI